MHSFEVQSNESASRKSGPLGMDQVCYYYLQKQQQYQNTAIATKLEGGFDRSINFVYTFFSSVLLFRLFLLIILLLFYILIQCVRKYYRLKQQQYHNTEAATIAEVTYDRSIECIFVFSVASIFSFCLFSDNLFFCYISIILLVYNYYLQKQ